MGHWRSTLKHLNQPGNRKVSGGNHAGAEIILELRSEEGPGVRRG